VESRRELAGRVGLTDARAAVETGPEGEFMLHVECSGHEKAALDGIRAVRKGGESVLVGTPWQRRTEIYAAEFMNAVFFRYVNVRSGWEWQVPLHPTEFAGNSIHENFAGALRWIASGRLKVDGLGCIFEPERAQEAYQGLLKGDLPAPAVIFRWRE
jgi:threonine dehydrogenase-like Zn-dependent dehydrogenase